MSAYAKALVTETLAHTARSTTRTHQFQKRSLAKSVLITVSLVLALIALVSMLLIKNSRENDASDSELVSSVRFAKSLTSEIGSKFASLASVVFNPSEVKDEENVYDGPVPEPTLEEEDENDDPKKKKKKRKNGSDEQEADETDNDGNSDSFSTTSDDFDRVVFDESDEGKYKRDERRRERDTNSKFYRVEQQTCPGMPTKKSLSIGQPKKNKQMIERKLDRLTDVVPTVGPGGDESKYVNISCVYITEKCANPSSASGRGIMRKLKFDVTSDEATKKYLKLAESLPSITDGSLGSCAIVANSDNLLKGNRGEEIDMHDTVFRHNTPMKGFQKAVGTKTTFTIVKSNYAGGGGGAGKAQGKGDSKPDLAYMLLKNIDLVPKSLLVEGRKVLLRSGGAHPIARLRRELYQLSGTPSKMHPTGGWARPLNVLASKLCERVDVYGFSGNNRGGKYFAKNLEVRPAHNMPFEHWSLRYLQSKGKLCVYGE
jgi:hypothetical protein